MLDMIFLSSVNSTWIVYSCFINIYMYVYLLKGAQERVPCHMMANFSLH